MAEPSSRPAVFRNSPPSPSNPRLGMPPAAASAVRARNRDQGDAAAGGFTACDSRTAWRDAFRAVRQETERRAAPLAAEDQQVQSMPDASPTKWHRAHSTWFLEEFLLRPHLAAYQVFDERFAYLFNSYYVAAGPRHARPRRGLLTRPDCAEITGFRAHVDAAIERLLSRCCRCTARRRGARARDCPPP